MKKAVLALFLFILIVSGCGNGKNIPANSKTAKPPQPPPSTAVCDIKENMFITQISDIYKNHKDFLGKTVRLEGFLKPAEYNGNHNYYVIRNAPGCCGDDGEVGFEVSWKPFYQGLDDGSDIKRYPQKSDWVEASGKLGTYQKSGMQYLYISLSELKVLENRGAEFVSR